MAIPARAGRRPHLCPCHPPLGATRQARRRDPQHHQYGFKDGIPGHETLSACEKEVIIALVQGMANKEIATHLRISDNTVITYRRNIAQKLQIHSPAGLTIYAIVNDLVDINAVKL